MVTATLSPALVATAGAVLSWPIGSPARRLRTLTITDTPRRRLKPRWPGPAILIGIPTLLAFLTSGIGVVIAVAVGGATIRVRWRARDRIRRQLSSAESMADGIHGLVAELRSGAHSVTAAESAAKDAGAPADAVLTAIATTARLGGDLTSVQQRFAADNPVLMPVLRPLIHAWTLAHQHGLPLADVLDAVRRDVAGRVRFAHKIRARMAGPKASGTVLAVLPLLGVLLGEAMGARPVHVLLTSSLGQTLLAFGTTLICAGLYWIDRLTSRAVLS
jgi:tight adherence protein B